MKLRSRATTFFFYVPRQVTPMKSYAQNKEWPIFDIYVIIYWHLGQNILTPITAFQTWKKIRTLVRKCGRVVKIRVQDLMGRRFDSAQEKSFLHARRSVFDPWCIYESCSSRFFESIYIIFTKKNFFQNFLIFFDGGKNFWKKNFFVKNYIDFFRKARETTFKNTLWTINASNWV